MNERIFRRAALARLASPDRTDILPSLPRRSAWLPVLSLAILAFLPFLITGLARPEAVLKAEGSFVAGTDGLPRVLCPLPAGASAPAGGLAARVLPGLEGWGSAKRGRTEFSEPGFLSIALDKAGGNPIPVGTPCRIRVILGRGENP